MTLGTRVKASRERARLSQRELADKIGISEISVMRLEKGRRLILVLTVLPFYGTVQTVQKPQ